MIQRYMCVVLAVVVVVAIAAVRSGEASELGAEGAAQFGQAGEAREAWKAFVASLTGAGVEATVLEPLPGVVPGDMGLTVGVPVAAGEVLASFPASLRLATPSVEAIRAAGGAPPSPADASIHDIMAMAMARGLDAKMALALALAHETVRDDWEASLLAGYIEILPETFDAAPLFYGRELVSEMQGGLAWRVVQQTKEAASLKSIVTQLESMFPALFPPASLEPHDVEWAYYLAHSRSWTTPSGELVLVPLMDMLHRTVNGSVEASVSKSGRIVLTATRDLAPGEEVFLNAAPASAAELFALHGPSLGGHALPDVAFLGLNYNPVDDNADNVFAATIDALLANAKCFTPDAVADLFYVGDELPLSFLACMRLALLTVDDYARISAREAATGESWPTDERFSADNDLAVFATIRASLTSSLDDYPTTIAEDNAALAELDSASTAAAIISLRKAEKQLFVSALSAVDRAWHAILADAADAQLLL
ncbi:uncharacterized protein AMSG_02734 [Thecamonas trahens ATCC 50062]|uniref:Rubisco LSMT substrate-binding domain-containing protein n=1 Tax=Thecamonas trahens ATCC 50062 TaxID=461836 RepID=A0A0L0D249_THETB|nr:hypothetical protein AMSG_02734 [Thecamonas trahens ATCC 50062]KNC46281.1 hypothetical protein AMSG_02734 [Thecamonas trahens ATCC 50062]|eukprot:XP_013760575.1 hypothetical protein AMSG_02734 [Thecamonas trahens ATCC 50062]